jgi:hypothetical protein
MLCLWAFTAGNVAAASHLCESLRGSNGVAPGAGWDVTHHSEDGPESHGGGETVGGTPHCNLCAHAATFGLAAPPSAIGLLCAQYPTPASPAEARLPLDIPDRLDEPPR